MASTYNDLYLDTRQELRQAGVPAAQLEARELLCFAADKSREQLYRDMPLYAPDHIARRFRELVKRRLAGEPLAYIIGEWDFYGITLDICRDVLIPRPDTETLVDRGIEFVKRLPGVTRVLDLCAGSGCVGVALARHSPRSRVILADWSEDALRICRQNIRRCDLISRMSTTRVDALEPAPSGLSDFDLILCNPPYIPTGEIPGLEISVRDYEPRLALDGGLDGLDFYRSVATGWKAALRLGGKLCFEVGFDQAEAVEQIMELNGYERILVTEDAAGRCRVVEGVCKD